MKILVTGSSGFIGKNLLQNLYLNDMNEVTTFESSEDINLLSIKIKDIDFVIHLAGVNRTHNKEDFNLINYNLTKTLFNQLKKINKKIPFIFVSSIHSGLKTEYGISKKNAELFLEQNASKKNPVKIYQLQNVFGKWCKPNYNSVVATFCYNTANKLPIKIENDNKELTLIYIDDVVEDISNSIKKDFKIYEIVSILPEYKITIRDLAKKITSFAEVSNNLNVDEVGEGFLRAIYSTYLSYLPIDKFTYNIPLYEDERGKFAEILKTPKSGQVSFFTCKPGMTRGKHYHNTKSEKFLVIKGEAKFVLKNIQTSESVIINSNDSENKIVQTIPGWYHEISNVGNQDLYVILWANEIYDKEKPDTFNRNL